MKIFLMGYRKLDFADSVDPSRRITGYNLFLAQEDENVVGVFPVSKEGKRFLTAANAKQLGVTDQWLDDRIDGFIDIDINFDGKIVDIRDYFDPSDAAADPKKK